MLLISRLGPRLGVYRLRSVLPVDRDPELIGELLPYLRGEAGSRAGLKDKGKEGPGKLETQKKGVYDPRVRVTVGTVFYGSLVRSPVRPGPRPLNRTPDLG